MCMFRKFIWLKCFLISQNLELTPPKVKPLMSLSMHEESDFFSWNSLLVSISSFRIVLSTNPSLSFGWYSRITGWLDYSLILMD
jgi:hypothetical protein